ncbi:MAG: type II toxin-antitoxin system death-on-curing family toxin [Bosea sp. (in: a-proteobacteria)]
MSGWVWIDIDDAISFHDQQISVHGGAAGIRDPGLLESALARPQMKAQYGAEDISELAAAYAYGIARNHPFIDGNKRTALVVMEAFLVVHGFELKADNAEAVALILALAAGEVTEQQLAAWVRDKLLPFESE